MLISQAIFAYSLLLLVAAPVKAGGSHQNIMLIMWEPLIMQELLISIMQEPKSGHSWTSKVFNTVITLDTYQFNKSCAPNPIKSNGLINSNLSKSRFLSK